MWQQFAMGNIQQIGYNLQTEQHLPFGLKNMLFCLGNVTIEYTYAQRFQGSMKQTALKAATSLGTIVHSGGSRILKRRFQWACD